MVQPKKSGYLKMDRSANNFIYLCGMCFRIYVFFGRFK